MKKITKGKLGDLVFQINPTEFTRSTAGVYNEVASPGMHKPIIVYGGGSNRTYQFDLYLNKRHANPLPYNIQHYIDTFERYSEHGDIVLFTYAGKSQRVIVESVDTTVLGMDESLNPIEATISLSLKEITL